jgi:tetratricopeptide (TPR) repeat protein
VLIALPCAQHASLAASAQEHFGRALRYRFAGRTDAAIAEYARGLEQDPDSVEGHAQLGTLLLEEKGDVDGAISQFMTALSIDPQCKFFQTRLQEALDRKNGKALDEITRGNQLYSGGQLNRALGAYRIALHIEPSDAIAHNSLAWTLYRLGELEEGMAEVNEALRLKPNDPEFVNTLACLLFDRGDVNGALAEWKRALSLSKTPNPADLYGMAIGMLAKGDQASAGRYFNQAIKIDPKYADLSYVRDRIGMSVRALATHDKLLWLANMQAASPENQAK